jgi:hypothetical protein
MNDTKTPEARSQISQHEMIEVGNSSGLKGFLITPL